MTAPLDHVELVLGILSLAVFAGAGGLGVAAIVREVRPQWRRIVRLASGHVEQGFAPLAAASDTTPAVTVTLITSAERGFVAARGRK